MNDVLITVQGNIGGDLRQHDGPHGLIASFSVGCTPRRFDRASQTWVDAEVQWYAVSAFRHLARHCLDSLNRGDPVIVHGTLSTRSYEHEGQQRTELDIKARSVGHDLSLGTSRFVRMPSLQQVLPPVPEEVAA